MISEDLLIQMIEQANTSGRTSTFAEFLVSLFKDKFIEIYLGDSYEDVSLEQTSMSYPAVFCGKVVAAYRECLIINCAYSSNHSRATNSKSSNKMSLGNFVFINERAIRALNEIDGNGVLEDMFLRSRESLDIKNIK